MSEIFRAVYPNNNHVTTHPDVVTQNLQLLTNFNTVPIYKHFAYFLLKLHQQALYALLATCIVQMCVLTMNYLAESKLFAKIIRRQLWQAKKPIQLK